MLISRHVTVLPARLLIMQYGNTARTVPGHPVLTHATLASALTFFKGFYSSLKPVPIEAVGRDQYLGLWPGGQAAAADLDHADSAASPLHCSLSSIVRSPLSRMWTLPGQFLSGACTKIRRLYQTLSVRSDSSSSESVNTTRWRQSSRTTPWLHIRNNAKDERDFPYNIEIR